MTKQTTPGPPVFFCWAVSPSTARTLGARHLGLNSEDTWAKATGLIDERSVRPTRYAVRPLEGKTFRLTIDDE